MQAMILAAGFGTRLLPFSAYRPKPLFPILNTPLLRLTIERLQAAGFAHIVVNCHHLCAQVREVVEQCAGVVLQQEDHIMGTGGGLRHALEHFDDRPLLVVNGDIYHTIDLGNLYRHHKERGMPVTLAVHDFPRFNSLQVADGRLCGFDGPGESPALAFTGIQVINPGILKAIPPGLQSCIIDRYREMLEAKETIAVQRVDHDYWTDMGTPRDYLDLHGALLGRNIPCWRELQHVAAPFCIDGNAVIGKQVKMLDWCSIGRARIGNEVTISRSVIWDGAEVPDGSTISDAIIPADYRK